jgi:hypothetical protein
MTTPPCQEQKEPLKAARSTRVCVAHSGFKVVTTPWVNGERVQRGR